MPRRNQSKRDKRLADLVTSRYFDAADQRIPRIEVWDKSYQAHDPYYVDKTKVDPPYTKAGYLHRVTKQQKTQVIESMDANGRWLNAQPVTPAQRGSAEAVTNFLEFQYRQKSADLHLSNRRSSERVAHMGLKYGNAYFLCQWERHPDWWGVNCLSLDPYDVYLDAAYGRFYIIRRVVTLAQLRDIATGISGPTQAVDPNTKETVDLEPRDGGRAERAVRKIERAIRAGNIGTYLYDETALGHGNSRRFTTNRVQGDADLPDVRVAAKDDPFNAPIAILEYYETHRDGLISKIIPAFNDGENLVLQSEQNPYGACPVVPFIPNPVDNEFYGLSNYEIAGRPADAIDYNLRAQLSMIGATAWPPLLYTRRANLRRQYLKSIYGLSIEVGDVRRDLGWMPPVPNQGVHQLGQQVAQQAADMASGESAVRRGDVGQARNATSAAIAETAGNVTDKSIFSQWRDTTEQVGHVVLAISRVHVTKEELIPILGRQSRDFYKLKPEFLDGQWTVVFGGSPRGANSTQQIATHLNIFQTYGPQGVVDPRESAREVYYLAGERAPDRFLVQKDPIPVVPPDEEEESILRFGGDPAISEQENLLEHVQHHARTLDQWTREMPPDDPRLADLQFHFQLTLNLWQQQQAAQAGAGGTGGGPQALSPDQVGQPGQPGTFQPATAGVNGARQGSNDAAAGQSPGPTGSVPGRALGGVVTGAQAPRR